MKAFFLVVLALVIIFMGPWFTILSAEVFLGTEIGLSIGTWFAALWVMILFASGR